MPSPAPCLMTLAMTPTRARPQRAIRAWRSVRRRATLHVRSCSARSAPMFWKTGLPPGLSCSWGLVDLAHDCGRGRRLVGSRASSDDLLKALAAALPTDHRPEAVSRPEDHSADQRLAGERAVAVPDRCFQ